LSWWLKSSEKSIINSQDKLVLTGKNGTPGLCIPSLTFIGIGGGAFGFG
jgi:hypothetical protein